MSHRAVLISTLLRLRAFFERFDMNWYIQSSLAATIHGVSNRNVTDIDVPADCDIRHLYAKIRQHLDNRAQLRPPVSYTHGEFRNCCIILMIESPRTHVDITTEINTYGALAF